MRKRPRCNWKAWGEFLCDPGHVSWSTGWDPSDNSLSHSPKSRMFAQHSSWGAWAVSRADALTASPSPASPACEELLLWGVSVSLPPDMSSWTCQQETKSGAASLLFSPKSPDISENRSEAYAYVPDFIFGLQASKAHVQSFSGLLLPCKEVCHLQMNEYSPNMWEITSNVKTHTGYQEWNSSAGPPVPAIAPISCCRNTQQRKQEPPQCCCYAWKRCLMFGRLKKRFSD